MFLPLIDLKYHIYQALQYFTYLDIFLHLLICSSYLSMWAGTSTKHFNYYGFQQVEYLVRLVLTYFSFSLACSHLKKIIPTVELAYQVPQRILLILLLGQHGIWLNSRSTDPSVRVFVCKKTVCPTPLHTLSVVPFFSHKTFSMKLSFVRFILRHFNSFVAVTNVVVFFLSVLKMVVNCV